MRITNTLIILLFCISCTENSQGEKSIKNSKDFKILYQKARTDTLPLSHRRDFINNALAMCQDEDSIKADVLYSKCNIHFLLQEYDSLLIHGKRLLTHTGQTKNLIVQGKYFHLLGYYQSKVKLNLDSAFYYQNQAKNRFIAANDSTNAGRRLLSMGILQHNRNDFFGSKETLIEALQYFSVANNNSKYRASILNELAVNHRKLLNYSDAISYYIEAIKITNSNKSKLAYKNNLATTYIDNREFKKAIQLLREIKRDTSLKKNTSTHARVLDNLFYAQWLDHQNINENHFIKALKIRKKNDKRGQIASFTHLGEFFSKTNPKKAERYLDTVIQLSKQLNIPKAEQDALKFLMSLQPNSISIRNRYVFLQDSLFQVGLKVKTQFAKMKYDDELKEHAILKLEAETAKQNAELANERFQKVLFFFLSSLVILGATTLFYFLKQRHKKEKLQEVYTTERRISKRVHDELANDIYGVMTNMEHSKSFEKEKVLDTLENIYRRTRDISHETGEVNTKDYKAELKRLLTQYQSSKTSVTVKGLNTIVWDKVDDLKKVALYRVINEFLVNTKKHSGASLVIVGFEHVKNTLEIEYVDNGSGAKLPLKQGSGLPNTENRIKSIGGTFSFDSEPGKGVRIRFSFPI